MTKDEQAALPLRQRIKAEIAIHDELWLEPDERVWTQTQRATVGEFRRLIEYVEELEAALTAPPSPAQEETYARGCICPQDGSTCWTCGGKPCVAGDRQED